MIETADSFLSAEQIQVRDAARRVAHDRIAPTAAERDRDSRWPHAELKAIGELGFMGMLIPAEYGGSGSSVLDYCLVHQEWAGADAGLATISHVHNFTGRLLANVGTEAQKRRYLPAMARGELIGASLITEPQAGSDTAALAMSARRDGDHYVLNGTKQFISNGSEAGVGVVFAVTDKAQGKRGFTAFVVDPKREGYKVLRIENKLGQRTAHTAQIQFDNYRARADEILGEEGRGYAMAMGSLSEGRIGVAAISTGVAHAALQAAIRYANERQAYGAPISRLQAVAFDLAQMASRVEVSQQYWNYAARLCDIGKECAKEAAIAKLCASENAERVCSDALQIHGGYGYLNDFPVERYLRDVRVCKIYEGTSHIQKLIISRHLS